MVWACSGAAAAGLKAPSSASGSDSEAEPESAAECLRVGQIGELNSDHKLEIYQNRNAEGAAQLI